MIATNTKGTDYIDDRYLSFGDFIAARNKLDSTGTADFVFHRWSSCRITDYDLSDEEIAERNRYIHQCRLRLFSDMGAFVLNGQLVYWRPTDRMIPRQILDRRPMVILAGFMPEDRGRHWKRKYSR